MAKSILNKNGVLLTILWSVTVVWTILNLSFGWFSWYDMTLFCAGEELTQLTFVVIPLIFAFAAARFTSRSGKIAAILLALMHLLFGVSYILSLKLGINIFGFLGNFSNIVTGIIDYGMFIWMILALNTTTAVKVTGIITQIPLFLSSIVITVWQILASGSNYMDYELNNILNILIVICNYLYLITVIIALIFAIVSINKRQVQPKIPYRPVV